MATHRFTALLWAWRDRPDSWVFLTVPDEVTDDIVAAAAAAPRGFGSVRVRVRIGGSTWDTSVFPSREEGGYVLPVKRPVRRAEDLDVGEMACVELTVGGAE